VSEPTQETTKRSPVLALHYGGPSEKWVELLQQMLPDADIRNWPEWGDLDEIDYAATWKPPLGMLKSCSNLKAVFSLGAGVDQLLVDPDFPKSIPLVRMLDAGLEEGMAEYVTLAVLALHRDLPAYVSSQPKRQWRPLDQRPASDRRVGILGLGKLGCGAAAALSPFGFRLSGWSRTRKQIEGIDCFAGDEELPAFLAAVDYLVVLVPLTEETRGLLDGIRLSMLPKGAAIINAARGAVLQIEEAYPLLESGHLSHLWLDVHHIEPLPQDHWSWTHDKVTVTPHIAASSLPETACRLIVSGIKDFESGRQPANIVDVEKGY
jgi:glyoxylate/hydroxypyruvate reductase A